MILRSQFLAQQRAYPRATIPPGARAAGLAARPHGLSIQSNGAAWAPLGPAPIDASPLVTALAGTAVNGRLTAILSVGNTLYVGAAPGGVCRSADQATIWTPLTDSQASLAIGSLAVDPQNSNTIYAGTDAGVYQTTNGGTTWTLLNNGFPNVAVFALALNNNQRVLRAAPRGRDVFELNLSGTLPPSTRRARTFRSRRSEARRCAHSRSTNC